jgi:hypothetical protein
MLGDMLDSILSLSPGGAERLVSVRVVGQKSWQTFNRAGEAVQAAIRVAGS